jgi:prepilin-type N-terminal cleavage/methylation domain-containing protein
MSNEKGFTLIELLAGLLLFSIVSVAAVSLTVQAMHNNTNAEATNSLRNDAAYVTQVLRTAYENGNLDGMCLNKEEENILRSKSDEIITLQLNDNKLSAIEFSYKGSDPSKPNCFNSQSEVKTLQVNFTISHENINKKTETFDVVTAFTKPTDEELTVSITQPTLPPITNPDDEESKPDDKEEDKPPVAEEPEEPYKPEEPSDSTDEIPDGCDYYGDTKLADSQFGDWKYCPIINIHDGSLWIPMSTSIFIQFNIDHNFYVSGNLTGQQNAIINAKDDSFIKNNVNLHSQNLFTGRNLTAGGTFILDTKSSVQLKGSLQTGGTTEFRSNTSVTAGKNVTLGGNTTIQENAKVNTGGNFLLMGNLQLTSNPNVVIKGNTEIRGAYNSENNSYVEVGKNFTIENKINLKSNSVLYIKGDAHLNGNVHIQENAKIVSDGDIYIKGKITPDWGGGTICAKGDIKMDQPYTGHEVKIQPNNQKCQK